MFSFVVCLIWCLSISLWGSYSYNCINSDNNYGFSHFVVTAYNINSNTNNNNKNKAAAPTKVNSIAVPTKGSTIPTLGLQVTVDEVVVSSIKSRTISPWSLPQLSRTDRRNIKLIFLLVVLAIESTSEIYVRLPQEMIYGRRPEPIPLAANSEDADSVVLIFPGAGGPDYNTDKLQRSITADDRIKGIHRVVSVYDWSAWTGSFIRAAFDSQIVGRTVCSSLAKDGLSAANHHPLKSLHAIGRDRALNSSSSAQLSLDLI